jgi:hypothetical protein
VTVNKYLIYILLFLTPFYAIAQDAVQDTVAPPEVTFISGYTDTLFYKERAFKPDFKEAYTGTDFKYEVKAKSRSQWDRFLEWLARILSEIFNVGSKTTSTPAYVMIIRIMAVLIILFVVYLIVKAIINKEGIWIFGRSRKNIRVEDVAGENIHEMNFDQLIDETTATGNYRLALRYYYLWLLKKLSARAIIDWNWDKTNRDYLYEINDRQLRDNFEYLSYLYDYSWYGEFPLDDASFAKAEKAFKKTLNTL